MTTDQPAPYRAGDGASLADQPRSASSHGALSSALRRYSTFLPITLLLVVSLCIGFLTVKDYGESWDEADIYDYADYALHAYPFLFHANELQAFETNLNLYGPGFFMVADVGAELLTRIVPSWSRIDGWHFMYFAAFLGCALSIYLLARRWTGEPAALGTTVLFLAQPLLWGHAFINPKDIPFMALFAASILAGLAMTDSYLARGKLHAAVLPASLLLGLTASFRVIGPLAGLIVLAYAVYKLKRRAAILAIPYLAIAGIVAYLTWPYLWSSPFPHYVESLLTMSQFPFATEVMFKGILFEAKDLPWTYFPTFLALQLTEPALLLLAIGIISSVWLWHKQQSRGASALFLAWFLLPALIIVGSHSPLYDNGRQLYFLYPPLFIVMGIGLERLFSYRILASPMARGTVVLLASLPGLIAGIQLHPYEYTYYNALAGGTGAVFRKYELDYWGTSLKEMAEYINATLPPGTKVLVFGPEQIAAHYVQSDIHVIIPSDRTRLGFDYAVLMTRDNLDRRRCKDGEIVHEVGREGAVFAVLKKIPGGAACR